MQTNNDVIKANKKFEGQTCAICKKEIFLGDLIHICNKCQSINHEDCWKKEKGCKSPDCNPNIENEKANNTNSIQTNKNISNLPLKQNNMSDNIPSNMIPCRWCKEPIIRGAKKCKHCNEYQKDEDRNLAYKLDDKDTTFTIIDCLSLVCCPFYIAIILGTYYCSSFQVEKGVRLLKYSLIWTTIIALILFILQILIH